MGEVEVSDSYIEGFRKAAEAHGLDPDGLMASQAYVAGFMKTAEAYGIDPDALMKEAQWKWLKTVGSFLTRGGREAAKHSKELKELTQIGKGTANRAQEILSGAKASLEAARTPIQRMSSTGRALSKDYAGQNWFRRFMTRRLVSKDVAKELEAYRNFVIQKNQYNKLEGIARKYGLKPGVGPKKVTPEDILSGKFKQPAPVANPATSATAPASTTPTTTPAPAVQPAGAPAAGIANVNRAVDAATTAGGTTPEKSIGGSIWERLQGFASKHPAVSGALGGAAVTKLLSGGNGMSASDLKDILAAANGGGYGGYGVQLPPPPNYYSYKGTNWY